MSLVDADNEKTSDFESELRIRKGKQLDKIINDLYSNKNFKENLLTYFSEFFYTYKDYFKDIETYEDYIKYIRNIDTKSLAAILPFDDTEAETKGISKYI